MVQLACLLPSFSGHASVMLSFLKDKAFQPAALRQPVLLVLVDKDPPPAFLDSMGPGEIELVLRRLICFGCPRVPLLK